MIIRVISLKRSKKRREVFSSLNSHMNFDFYDAIDGSKMTRQMLKGTKLFQTGLPYTAGAYGAALSHLNL